MTSLRSENFPHSVALVKGDEHPAYDRAGKAAHRPRLRMVYTDHFCNVPVTYP